MSYASVFYILGFLSACFGGVMLLPAAVSFASGGTATEPFILSSVLTIFFGGSIVFMTKRETPKLKHKDAFLLTFLVWAVLSLIGAMPLYFSGVTPNFMDGFFESVSGLTTTGASVLSGLDHMDKGILLWRALLQWLGGMGVIVLATAIIPFLGVGGMQLYRAEMPGVEKDKLQPRLKETAELLWIVYLILTMSCAVLYFLAGMTVFDAICHAFTTVATGGYSTHDASFAYFDSFGIELVAIIFMILGAVNFGLHFLVFAKRNPLVLFRDSEVRVFLAFIVMAVILMSVKLVLSEHYDSVNETVRHALFNTTAVITTTGFSSQDYAMWPSMVPMLVMVLMFVGGCSGSTAGGLKVLRVIMIIKLGARELFKLIHPNSLTHLKVGGRTISPAMMQSVWSFAVLYIICFAVITWVLSLYGLDLVTAFSASAASITGLGPALGELGPASNYSDLPNGAKFVLCFAMLLGRLEVFTLLVIFTPAFWRR